MNFSWDFIATFIIRCIAYLMIRAGIYNVIVDVAIVGLKNSGKTTLFEASQKVCSVFNNDQLYCKGIIVDLNPFYVTDTEAHRTNKYKQYWGLFQMNAIVFVVDASDRKIIPKAKIEIYKLLKD